MIRTRDGFRKLGNWVWIVVSVPFVIIGFKHRLDFGLVALAIAIAGVHLNNRAFRQRGN
jgi:hypothetical protein